MAKSIHLHSWYSSASTGKSLRTWPSVSDAYLDWLDRVEAVYGGPLTPTLFDIAAVIGLRPHGVTISMAYNPDGVSDFETHLDLNDLTYSNILCRFLAEDTSGYEFFGGRSPGGIGSTGTLACEVTVLRERGIVYKTKHNQDIKFC
uniref:Uncharacterized protein n=1 Tax=Ananas comosus var. bracteatus TaxID=296719 RepID=A0A6V7NP72_ANACO|nr:unnamed protein product [Ananas comosus var. bracteatus]